MQLKFKNSNHCYPCKRCQWLGHLAKNAHTFLLAPTYKTISTIKKLVFSLSWYSECGGSVQIIIANTLAMIMLYLINLLSHINKAIFLCTSHTYECVSALLNMWQHLQIWKQVSCEKKVVQGGEAANFLVQILWSITLNNEVSPNSVWIVDYYSIQLIKKTKLVKSGYQWQ